MEHRVLSTKKVRNGVYAYRLINGGIEIQGELYLGYSMTDSIKLWRRKNKK